MRVTQGGEYGVHFSAYIALQEREGKSPVGAAEIARSQGVELDYAHQILQRLRKGEIVQSVRGVQGGYRLSREPSDISLGQILRAAEGDTFEVMCEVKPLSSDRCDPGSACGLRGVWFDLRAHINDFLEKRTLADIIRQEIGKDHPVQIGSLETVHGIISSGE